jgi:uncharacterized protein DUF5985
MAEVVYVLCAATSLACAVLLLNEYRKNRTRLLFWSSVCFIGLAANSIVMFVDLVIVPTRDLSILRGLLAVAAMGALVYGLIWESR